jgi:metal-dependent amidase/aminoacylase/carboxypeptidase family protein
MPLNLLFISFLTAFLLQPVVEKLGAIGCSEGPIMAASDAFAINVKGKGGHGAAPQQTVH